MKAKGTLRRLGAVLLALALCACVSPLPRLPEADGSYCYSIGHGSVARRTCTTTAIPGEAVQAEVQRFETKADAATIYIVRRRWADTINRVAVRIDGQRGVDTIPDSVVRIRLRPESHVLSLDWQGHIDTRTLILRNGELRFLEIHGSEMIGAATTAGWMTTLTARSDAQSSRS